MDKIKYNGNEYNKLYAHTNGGTYFTSASADWVSCWLDVYPNNSVYELLDGKLYLVGYLLENRVISLGMKVKYTVKDFDGTTVLFGTVSRIEKDHFIVDADEMHLWIDEDNIYTITII